MNFELTDDQRMVRDTARDFATREIAPLAAELDKTERWPAEIIAKMAELGFLGVAIPSEFGGAGLDTLSYALVMEEISAACASCGVIMSVNNSLFSDPVYKFGTEAQKREILTPVASGKVLGCFGLTEPMSGSDAQTMATVGAKVDGGFVLNGAKNWITNGPHAEHLIVFAITERSPSGKAKHTAFLVPRGAAGFTANPRDHKLGIRAAHSCTLFFQDCFVPDSAVVGQVGDGFKVAMATLDGGRIGIACQALGIARAALEAATAYSKERKSFGKTISEHQAISFMLADMATQLDAARLLTWRAAALKDAGVRHSVESAMAKLYASEASTRITHKALQIFGGYGYSTEYPAERHYRDARITEIYEGTSEIQRLVIAAGVLRG